VALVDWSSRIITCFFASFEFAIPSSCEMHMNSLGQIDPLAQSIPSIVWPSLVVGTLTSITLIPKPSKFFTCLFFGSFSLIWRLIKLH
jgi:hypothetical protein